MNSDLGRILIIVGAVLIVAGIAFPLLMKTGIGKLPGDIFIKRDNFTFYFPITTSILFSLILGIIFYLWNQK